MKKIAAIILAVLFGTSLTFGHNMEGGSTKGLFGLKAEYVHILLNPLPVYGLSMGVFVLAAALLVRSKSTRNIGLLLIVICAASAWPVLYYGQHGYNHLYPQLDTDSQKCLEVHMDRAERFIYAFYLTALLGITALLAQKQFPRTASALTGVTLAVAVASLGIGAWISRAGGEVSHSEFRNEDQPPGAPGQMHEMAGPSHEGMQMSDTNGSHQHDMAARSTNLSSPMPNTPEGIWNQIHQHHSELGAAMKAQKLDGIHPHAVALRNLTTALVDVAHPDHKAAVQSGVDKVNRALGELHQSADSGNEAAAATNFNNFEAALKQLEEQMNKQ